MNWADFALQMVTGVQLGAIYVLVALGLTLILGTLGVANFAHGALYMIGAYLTWIVASEVGWWLVIVAVPLVLFLLGVILERGLIQFFYKRPVTDQILVTFGLALVIQELLRWVYGGATQPFNPPMWALIPIDIGIGYYPPWRLIVIAVAAAIVLALFLGLRYTRFGLVIRAGMRDPETLRFLGINIGLRFTIVFGFGAVLAGIAGIVGGPILPISPGVGMEVLVPSFLVVVIGGLGSIVGAIVAGLLMGVASSLMILIYPPMTQVVMYLVAIIVLSVRPRGLFGTKGMHA